MLVGDAFRIRSGDSFATYTLVLPAFAVLLTGVVFGNILLYRAWRCLARHVPRFDPNRRPLDPAAAVAFTLIPVFNLVSIFLSLAPLPIQLNWLAGAVGVRERANKDLGMATAIVALGALIPVVGLILGAVAGLIMLPNLLCSCSEVAEAIEESLSSAEGPKQS
jgi:hypothetical protein